LIATGAVQIKAPVTVKINGEPAEVLYKGAAPGIVNGFLQINAKVPAGLSRGPASLVVTIGEASSQAGVTVFIK
jgi:uncharacterized protein (TIGR03437 family)